MPDSAEVRRSYEKYIRAEPFDHAFRPPGLGTQTFSAENWFWSEALRSKVYILCLRGGGSRGLDSLSYDCLQRDLAGHRAF